MGSWDFAKLGECEHGIPSAVRNPDSEATSSLMALSTAPLPPRAVRPGGEGGPGFPEGLGPLRAGDPNSQDWGLGSRWCWWVNLCDLLVSHQRLANTFKG